MPKYYFFYYVQRLWTIGLCTACWLIYYRFKKAYFIRRWQYKCKRFDLLTKLSEGPIAVKILGFGEHTFASTNGISWHSDFFTTTSPPSWAHTFFAAITIPSNKQINILTARQPDIKVPWELSRLHCLHNQSLETALAILSSWMINNPFPYGVNWLNPMEVSIRAINIIAMLKTHTGNPALTPVIIAQISELLRYHAYFIESCWEVSATPNNHYLTDLVGYLHLCCFLNITKYYRKRHQAWQWVQDALKQQLLPDGTCYEGSTAYHSLVTELFDLALACAQEHSLSINQALYITQQKMHEFIIDCTDQTGNLVLIGDNDSGRICPLPSKQKKMALNAPQQKTYPFFGLTIIKNSRCFFTLRHATYSPQQPTGHFHRDELAITLSIDEIPLFIDPGSYLYTAHPQWRNALRAASTHTTVIPEAHKLIPRNLDLFQLPKSASPAALHEIQARHSWEKINITRDCSLSTHELIITDTITSNTKEITTWYWHLGPTIKLHAIDMHTWLLLHEQKPLAQLHGPLPWHVQQSRASTVYGAYESTTILSCSAQTQQGNKMVQQFRTTLMR